jgi:hypothetical protein
LYGPKDNALPKGKSLTTCPECYAVHVSGTRTCQFCGFSLVKSVDGQVADQLPEIAAGELVEFTQAQRMAAKRSRFFQLVDEANMRGYSMGWVGHKYKAEFGAWPGSQWKAQVRKPQSEPAKPKREPFDWESLWPDQPGAKPMLNCRHCGPVTFYTEKVPPHLGAYCDKCRDWIKWVPQEARA